jgi:hypothetical protein
MLAATRSLGSKPSGVRRRSCSVRPVSAAPTSTRRQIATCATTSTSRAPNRRPHRPPSPSSHAAPGRAAASAGSSPRRSGARRGDRERRRHHRDVRLHRNAADDETAAGESADQRQDRERQCRPDQRERDGLRQQAGHQVAARTASTPEVRRATASAKAAADHAGS